MNRNSLHALYRIFPPHAGGLLETGIEACYDRLAVSGIADMDHWTKENLANFRPRHLLLVRALQAHLSGRRHTIVDIGCHNGFFLRLSSEAGLDFERFVGIDFFELPPQRSFLAGLRGFEFLKRNFNESDFLADIPSHCADCVVSTEVFEHLYHHPVGYLEECMRILRSGGLLLLTTPNPCTLANALRLTVGKPVSWGGVAFAKTPKLLADGQPLAVWDIHFREYAACELREIIGSIHSTRVLESGFISSASGPNESLAKKLAKSIISRFGLASWRPLAGTQYMVVRKV